MSSSSIQQYREPRRLHGLPGTIYVLSNTALKENIFLVGFSRRSGWAKAGELNREKSNTLPGVYECAFEMQAQDGGLAIEAIFNEIVTGRIGKRDYDFFEIQKEKLEEIVMRVVKETDHHVQNKYRQHTKMREYADEQLLMEKRQVVEQERQAEIQKETQKETQREIQKRMNLPVREGIFKQANLWVNKILS